MRSNTDSNIDYYRDEHRGSFDGSNCNFRMGKIEIFRLLSFQFASHLKLVQPSNVSFTAIYTSARIYRRPIFVTNLYHFISRIFLKH